MVYQLNYIPHVNHALKKYEERYGKTVAQIFIIVVLCVIRINANTLNLCIFMFNISPENSPDDFPGGTDQPNVILKVVSSRVSCFQKNKIQGIMEKAYASIASSFW